jgi:hypothetical protein
MSDARPGLLAGAKGEGRRKQRQAGDDGKRIKMK